jgi:hypothetical protein
MSRQSNRHQTPRFFDLGIGMAVTISLAAVMGRFASAEQIVLQESADAVQARQLSSLPHSTSETRVKVYTDSRGRTVREVDLHVVIVGGNASGESELVPWDGDQGSIAGIAQSALANAFDAASQGLAKTFDDNNQLDATPLITFDQLDLADIFAASDFDRSTLWPEDSLLSSQIASSTTVPEPSTAIFVFVGLIVILIRRRRRQAAFAVVHSRQNRNRTQANGRWS